MVIRKIYGVNPLICPTWQGSMRGISFIEGPPVIRTILEPMG